MMVRYLESVALIGAIQVGVVATIALMVTQYWLRNNTRNSSSELVSTSTLCGATLAMAFVMTLAAPLPIEKWLSAIPWNSTLKEDERFAEGVVQRGNGPAEKSDASLSQMNYFFLPVEKIRERLGRVVGATPSNHRPSRWVSVLFYSCSVLTAFGVVRVLIAVFPRFNYVDELQRLITFESIARWPD